MKRALPLVALALVGCGKKDRPAKLTETGWFSDTGLWSAQACKERLGGVTPVDGTDDWYHRDDPGFYVEKANPAAYDVEIVDASGEPAPVDLVWDAESQLKATFVLREPLKPATDYTVTITDCAEVHRSTFRTSNLGLPMTVDVESLEGKTWHLDMLGADWLQPGGAEALIQLYFSAPALLGVRFVDGDRIDLLGAPGEVDPFGNLYQGPGATWDFPTGDFDPPYFENQASLVVFQFEGVEIPIYDARLAATFSPDGNGIGGGELSGLGDTRDLGSFLPGGGSNDAAICDLAASFGIDCETCPDGQPYCMFLEARQIDGALVDGLTLIPRN